jgi:uncharacterized protein
MQLFDVVYGQVTIEDAAALDIIATPSFQRLRAVHQAGPSWLVFPERSVTRLEHSVGVYLLLRRVGAPRLEQLAGLLHDISHTAFSHVVDQLFPSAEHDFHERYKAEFLRREDLRQALARHGLAPEALDSDEPFTLLEQPLPALCADRVDYFLRDGIAYGMLDRSFVARALGALEVRDGRLVLDDLEVARSMALGFAKVDRGIWSNRRDRHIYDSFATALRVALDAGVLSPPELFEDDEHVLGKLRGSRLPGVERALAEMAREPGPSEPDRAAPSKKRWLDPSVCSAGRCAPLSQWRAE